MHVVYLPLLFNMFVCFKIKHVTGTDTVKLCFITRFIREDCHREHFSNNAHS